MKKFTIGFILFLLLAVAGSLVFVGMSADFTEPARLPSQEGITEDHPIWDRTLDDLAAYLVEQGVIPSDEYSGLSDGIATEARGYSGLELYWWDVENLEEGSDEYTAYMSAVEEGTIDLWGSGNIMVVTGVRGPFALNIIGSYTGDAGKAEEVFRNFCTE